MRARCDREIIYFTVNNKMVN